jgi:hypothetical protein
MMLQKQSKIASQNCANLGNSLSANLLVNIGHHKKRKTDIYLVLQRTKTALQSPPSSASDAFSWCPPAPSSGG